MTVQVIEKDGQPEYAVLPYDEYRRLLELAEDALDRADADSALQELESGQDETVPVDVVSRLVSGKEHPLKVWREHRGLTQETLGRAAGVGKSYISQIESGTKTGSARVLQALAGTLGVDVDDLIA